MSTTVSLATATTGASIDLSFGARMIAIPIGPREQRFAIAASSAYLGRCGRPVTRVACLTMLTCSVGSQSAPC